MWICLYFVQKNNGILFSAQLRSGYSTDLKIKAVDRPHILKQTLTVFIIKKVEFNKVRKQLFPDMPHNKRLSNLPSAIDQQYFFCSGGKMLFYLSCNFAI